MKKILRIAFLMLMMQSNLFAQDILNRSLDNIKEYLSINEKNINYSEENDESGEKIIQFYFKHNPYKVSTVFFKKMEDGTFSCYMERLAMPYSKEILNSTWREFEKLGYVKTNYKTQEGRFPVFVSKDESNNSLKKYLVLFIRKDEDIEILGVDHSLDTSEFILED